MIFEFLYLINDFCLIFRFFIFVFCFSSFCHFVFLFPSFFHFVFDFWFLYFCICFLGAIFRFFVRYAPHYCFWMWYFLLNTCHELNIQLETRGFYYLAKDYGHLEQDIVRSVSRKQLVCSSSHTRGPLSNLYHDGPTLNLRIMPECNTSEQAT